MTNWLHLSSTIYQWYCWRMNLWCRSWVEVEELLIQAFGVLRACYGEVSSFMLGDSSGRNQDVYAWCYYFCILLINLPTIHAKRHKLWRATNPNSWSQCSCSSKEDDILILSLVATSWYWKNNVREWGGNSRTLSTFVRHLRYNPNFEDKIPLRAYCNDM